MKGQESIQELQEALQRADERYNQAMLQLYRLSVASHRLSLEVAVACEAYLANDTETALHKLGQLAEAYQRNMTPKSGSLH